MNRQVLVILSNRLNRLQKPRFIEITCDEQGNILRQSTLRRPPREARFDEVWENDDGKTHFASCHSFTRHHGHPLPQPKNLAC